MADTSLDRLNDNPLRRERGWSLTFSRSGIDFRSFSYVDQSVSCDHATQERSSALRQYRTPKLLWLIPIIATCGSLTAGVLAAPAKSGGNPYSVSIPIPEAAAGNADRNPAYASTTADHRPTAGAKSRIDLSKARGVTEPRRTELDADRSSAPDGDPAAAEQHFIDVAMRTGVMQSWQSGTDRNFLVVGEPRMADDGSCRQFSLLRRSDTGEDSVEHFERCRGAS